MALTLDQRPKRSWKKPQLTTTPIDLPVVLTLCTGFAGICDDGSDTCCDNVGGECGFGGTCNPRP